MAELVPASLDDLPVCAEILSSGRDFQREQGFVQWRDDRPGPEEVAEDIRTGKGFTVKEAGMIAAYLYIGFDGDPAYPEIRGAWHQEGPYGVIHRMAIRASFRGKGFADTVFQLAEEYCRSKGFYNLRIDTAEANLRMRRALHRNGFSCCGTVIQNGGDRLAFDKQL